MIGIEPKTILSRKGSYRVERVSSTETRIVKVEEEEEPHSPPPLDVGKVLPTTPEYMFLLRDREKQKEIDAKALSTDVQEKINKEKIKLEKRDHERMMLYKRSKRFDRKPPLPPSASNNHILRGRVKIRPPKLKRPSSQPNLCSSSVASLRPSSQSSLRCQSVASDQPSSKSSLRCESVTSDQPSSKSSLRCQSVASDQPSSKSSLRCQSVASDRHVRFDVQSEFQDIAEPPRSSSAPPGIRAGDEKEKRPKSSYSQPGGGLGRIYLQMPDIIRPGASRTLSMTYSNSSLSESTKRLTDDIVKLSLKSGVNRHHVVNNIERRLNVMRNKKEQYERKITDYQRVKEDEEGELVVYATQQLERLAETEHMTASEKYANRKEKIRVRTLMLPENFRTANYLNKSVGKCMLQLVACRYIRNDDDNARSRTAEVNYTKAKLKQ